VLEIGEKAPEFVLRDANGKETRLSDFKGKWVVLYFYPKDNTSGCTKEACDFTELLPRFKDTEAIVIGVSPDTPESHKKFAARHNLKILLLSDPQKEALRAFGAWGKKKNYGKEYEGVKRSTFLIDPDGNIVWEWKNVRVRIKRKGQEIRHADQVLEKLNSLKKGISHEDAS